MPFASHEAAAIANAESFRFQCVPAFHELPHLWGFNSAEVIKPKQEVLDVILPQFDQAFTAEIEEFVSKQNFDTDDSGTLFNTCRAIEGEFLDLLAGVQRYRGKKLFAVGPLHPTSFESDGGHECLKWLDKQPRGSVVYVSFGSTSTLSDEQIKQLAIGLKSSGQRFMWVLRDADRGDIFADDNSENQQRKLPAGFEEEIQDMGMIVRGWAPQLEILAHPSTGAFVSHCGWNSCMESLSMGVPVIAWPMHSDQPRNAVMVTHYLKVGITVGDWARHEEVVQAGEIEEVIKRMMVDEEGKEIKKRAKLLGEEARLAVSEGGTSHEDLNSFIAHICR